jgi:ribonuclease HI
MAKQKYYVVWKGRRTGIFYTWLECSAQVTGFTDAKFKSFDSLAAAKSAFQGEYSAVIARAPATRPPKVALTRPVLPSISVDAACSGAPGPLEWRGVETETGREIFRFGPCPDGTNNVGEFLAIVQGQHWLAEHGLSWPIYSDSLNAILWIRLGKCRTKLAHTSRNILLFEMIASAEAGLALSKPARLLKWETEKWGENPADFGRK